MARMAAKRDYYEVLGLERTASGSEISDAYRKLAVQFHPDKNPGDEEAVAKFKEAAEAFEVLSDREKRARYDRYGHAGIDGIAGGAPHFSDASEIFEAFSDIFGDSVFGDLFGGGTRRRVRRGADVQCRVTLDLLEAARGTRKTVRFKRHEKCDTCDGSGVEPGKQPAACSYCGGRGQVIRSSGVFRIQTTCPSCHGAGNVIKDPCASCGGHGFVQREARREVMIPAGVDNDTRLRLEGEGEPSPQGGPPGDCYCFIRVREHPLFHREGQHLICHVPITYSQAALGAQIEVPTLEGPDTITIPAGTQPGEVFRLKRRGMPDPRHRSVGDLLVKIDVDVPKKLNSRQEELLRELAELEQQHVSPHRKTFFEQLRDYFAVHELQQSAED